MSWRNLSSLGLARAKKSVLIEAYIELTGQCDADECCYPATKRELLEEIEALREQERERIFREGSRKHVRASLCEIPASKVNEWLRSLPV